MIESAHFTFSELLYFSLLVILLLIFYKKYKREYVLKAFFHDGTDEAQLEKSNSMLHEVNSKCATMAFSATRCKIALYKGHELCLLYGKIGFVSASSGGKHWAENKRCFCIMPINCENYLEHNPQTFSKIFSDEYFAIYAVNLEKFISSQALP